MTEPGLVDRLRNRDDWNNWRSKNPDSTVDFSNVGFGTGPYNSISFAGLNFGNNAIFAGAVFGHNANFKGATFGKNANFRSATFGENANFENTTFNGYVDFTGGHFGPNANFSSAKFRGSERYMGSARFVNRSFGDSADFSDAIFADLADFDGATFVNEVFFTRTKFNQPPTFLLKAGREKLSFVDARFRFGWGIFRWTIEPKIVARLRRLRGLAQDTHALDAERDLFILERQAERGVLLMGCLRGSFWRAVSAIFLLSVYRALSNCGRSVVLPLVWLVGINYGAYFSYGRRFPCATHDQLLTLTLAGALPFGEVNKTALGKVAEKLFANAHGVIPPMVQLIAIGQGVVNALLVFLLALALRNHFKVK